jgi:hypothetical protein
METLLDFIISQLIASLIVYIPCIGISIAYFMAGKSKTLPNRVFKSSHGILIIIAFIFSSNAANFTTNGNLEPWMSIFNIILLLAGMSAVFSLFNYINFKWHFLYIIEALIGFIVWGLGIMALAHDSM